MILLTQSKHLVIRMCCFETSYTIKVILEKEPLHGPRAPGARTGFNALAS